MRNSLLLTKESLWMLGPEMVFLSTTARARISKRSSLVSTLTAVPLKKISERIHRKPAKGGLPNLLFVQSAVEGLPSELDGMADKLHVNFPWGSLLSAVAGVNGPALDNLRRICCHGASLQVIAGLDLERDAAEIKRLQLPVLSTDYMDTTLIANYRNSGFEVIERGILTASVAAELQTSWAKRLKGNPGRTLISIVARAV